MFAGTAALLAACGTAIDEDALLASASSQAAQITTDYPAVVMVAMPGGMGMCTGTFISPRTVLTAAHCTQQTGSYRVYTSFGAFDTNTVRRLGPGTTDDPSDLSILIFNQDIADPSLAHVFALGIAPRAGDLIRIVGYGCSNLITKLGAGLKRTGTNRLFQVSDYLELLSTPIEKIAATRSGKYILGAENQAGSCFGDSGGPMLQLQNDSWKVVGVTHAGGWSGSLIRSLYVNLGRNENQAFIRDVDSEFDLHLTDGCWTSPDPSACEPMGAGFNLFSFLRPVLLKIFAWFIF